MGAYVQAADVVVREFVFGRLLRSAPRVAWGFAVGLRVRLVPQGGPVFVAIEFGEFAPGVSGSAIRGNPPFDVIGVERRGAGALGLLGGLSKGLNKLLL